MSSFNLATDEEISDLIGGRRVVSFRVDDFSYDIHRDNLGLRFIGTRSFEIAAFLESKEVNLFDSAGKPLVHIPSLAIVSDFSVAKHLARGDPEYFIYTKPSQSWSAREIFASFCCFPEQEVAMPIPEQEALYILESHEIGHMHIYSSPEIGYFKQMEEPYSAYFQELYADIYALSRYIRAGGSAENVRHYINGRALQAFFEQPEQYWISNTLSSFFFADTDTEITINNASGSKTFNAQEVSAFVNMELSLRATGHTEGLYNLDEYTSDEIWKIMSTHKRPTEAHVIREAYDLFQEMQSNEQIISLHADMEKTSEVVERLVSNPNLDKKTTHLGKMVLAGILSYMPKLVPNDLLQRLGLSQQSTGQEINAALGLTSQLVDRVYDDQIQLFSSRDDNASLDNVPTPG